MKAIILSSFLVCLTSLSLKGCEGYRILGVFPFHARSHFMMFEALMKGLARKGHQVDVISTFPQNKPYPNYTDIIELPLSSPSFVNNMTYDFLQSVTGNLVQFIAQVAGTQACEAFENPEMVKLVRNPHYPPYDLVITEIFGAHCSLALGHHFKVPVIGLSSSALYPWGNGIVGNPANLAFAPNNLLNFSPPMMFWQRLYNTVHTAYNIAMFQYYTRSQDDIIKKYLGEDAPTVREAERSVALILTNSHPALNGPKPVTPALIEVGGLHVQDTGAELPLDLKEWMDNSTAGFIYFTFGSMVTIESFPEEIVQVIYKSFGKIAPVRVLIKIPNPKLLPPGLPDNFRTFKWAPQLRVLQHKNVKAFVTHGGLMGSQEAIHYGVPMIGIPLFADQFINIDLYTNMKIAVKVDYKSMTTETLDAALKEILYNPVYKNTMLAVSAKFLDRPMSSMDTAVWWVEYIVRRGSDALRSPAMDLTWWQIDLLDVYAFLLLIAALAAFLLIAIVQFCIYLFGEIAGSTSGIPRLNGQNSKKHE